MSTGIAKNTSVIGIKQEVSEGSYLAPASASDYFQPLADGFEISPSKDLIERKVITSSVGKVAPRVGMKKVSATMPVEFRASGVEGGKTDFDLLLQGALGNSRQIASRITTKNAGNTGSVLQIQDADIANLHVGDIIVVLEAGAHHACAISAVDSSAGAANITILPAKSSGSFSNSVQISKSSTYYPGSSGHPAISLSVYWANEILEKAIGCKVTGMSIDNFQTGQVASIKFALEGLSFDEVDGSAPHTPTYDVGLPPLILSAKVYQDGVEVPVNKFSLNLQNKLGFITSTGSSSGRISSRVVERTISGSIDPYKDDTSVANFTKFDANTGFTLFVAAYNPSAVAGEMDLGSVIGIYLPSCMITEKKVAEQDGILTDDLSFSANRGTSGNIEEMYLGLV